MSLVLSTCHIVLIRGSYSPWLQEQALAPPAFWPNFRGKVVHSSEHDLLGIDLRGTTVEFAPKLSIACGYSSCEYYVKFFTFMLTSTQS